MTYFHKLKDRSMEWAPDEGAPTLLGRGGLVEPWKGIGAIGRWERGECGQDGQGAGKKAVEHRDSSVAARFVSVPSSRTKLHAS